MLDLLLLDNRWEFEMKTQAGCKRVVLAGSDGCKVSYCEDCKVTELEIGALSLRLEMQAFNSLGEMMQEAMARLAVFNAATTEHEFYSRAGNVH